MAVYIKQYFCILCKGGDSVIGLVFSHFFLGAPFSQGVRDVNLTKEAKAL